MNIVLKKQLGYKIYRYLYFILLSKKKNMEFDI